MSPPRHLSIVCRCQRLYPQYGKPPFRRHCDGPLDMAGWAVRFLTGNLNGRRKVDGQLLAIEDRAPDLVALQELTGKSIVLLRAALPDAGLHHVVDSFDLSATWAVVGPRRYGLVIASRFPLTPTASGHVVPWPERMLSSAVSMPNGAVTVHTSTSLRDPATDGKRSRCWRR